MDTTDRTVLSTILEALRSRITKIFPAQIRTCIEQLSDDEIWWRPNESSNSVGNLVLHLSGSLNHYLNRAIGGFAYERDRAAEFAERRRIPKGELLTTFEEIVEGGANLRSFDARTARRSLSGGEALCVCDRRPALGCRSLVEPRRTDRLDHEDVEEWSAQRSLDEDAQGIGRLEAMERLVSRQD